MLEQLGGASPAATPTAVPTPPTPEELLAALTAALAAPTDAAPAVGASETQATDDPAADTTDASAAPSEPVITPQPLVGAVAPTVLPAAGAVAQPVAGATAPGVGASVAPSAVIATAVAAASPAPTAALTAAALTAAAVPRAASTSSTVGSTSSAAGSASAGASAGAAPAMPAGALDGVATVQLPHTRPAAPSTAPAAANGQPQASATPVASTASVAGGDEPMRPVAIVAAQTAADPAAAVPKDAAAPIAFVPAAAPTATMPVAAPASATPAAPVPLQTQVATPIFTLAAAGPGEHVMTIDISPENLGPITVRAHVGAEGVRVELFAPTDLSREALRAILPDIRKDMTGAGLGGTLDLSSQNQPADRGDERGQGRREPGGEMGVELEGVAGPSRPWLLADPATTIDVMA